MGQIGFSLRSTTTTSAMSLVIHNFTPNELFVHHALTKAQPETSSSKVSPLSAIELIMHPRRRLVHRNRHVNLSAHLEAKGCVVFLDRRSRKGSVCVLKDHDVELPWMVYWLKVGIIRRLCTTIFLHSCHSHVQESETVQRLVILPKRDLSRFLSDLDDDISLADLCLPGMSASSCGCAISLTSSHKEHTIREWHSCRWQICASMMQPLVSSCIFCRTG